jgi:hypothetical protein
VARELTYAAREHSLATGVLDETKARLAIAARPSDLRCSSEPLRPVARHSSASPQLSRAPPSADRPRTAHPPATRLRLCCATLPANFAHAP